MAQEAAPAVKPKRKRRIVRRAVLILLLLLGSALLWAWSQRVELAEGLIADTLDEYGIEATYEIVSISPQRQVLRNISVGDPAAPDLTVEQIEVSLTPRLGLPAVTEVRLVRPRLFGTMRDGQLSFGALDPLIFTGESDQPFEFPDMSLAIADGRGLIDSDFGRVGLRMSGEGHLRGGFEGELAAVAPVVSSNGCAAREATLYGAIGINAERPHFAGPVRIRSLACEDSGATLADLGLQLDLRADRNLADFEGTAQIRAGSSDLGGGHIAGLTGDSRFSWRDGGLTASLDLSARDLVSSAASVAALDVESLIRAPDGLGQFEIEGELSGTGIRLGDDVGQALLAGEQAAAGTLIAPLMEKVRRNLGRELAGSAMAASFIARQGEEGLSVVVPQARLVGRSGETLLALSRAQMALSGEGLPRFEGNLATGGNGMPRIVGRMEQSGNGPLELRVRMQEYAAGTARLTVPELAISQGRGGSVSFSGRVLASGPLPGGFARGLTVPLDGTYSTAGDLALWQGCRELRFDSLAVSNLALQRQSLTLCPPSGRPMLRFGGQGLDFAAGLDRLDLRGELAETPLALRSGPVGLAWPGTFVASDIEVALGAPGSEARFALADLTADISSETIGGTFSGTDVILPAVPLDILGAGGGWRYVGDRLELFDAAFTLEDQQAEDRFNPLRARDASLSLADGMIVAEARLVHPPTAIAVARVGLEHDLGSGAGHADLIVDGVTFAADGFQPRDLTELVYGVVTLVDGTVSGSGRIDWDAQGIASSGTFGSDSLDLAAAFGPVKGASGSVRFTDLLGLTTAPNQVVRIAAVNPGIEIYDGEVVFQLIDGQVVDLGGGTWPFLGGILRLNPMVINIGVEEERVYEIQIEGLEAARFIERMELNNLAASGTFDGFIPIVFDAMGNGRLEGGVLVARSGGGHLSYVGQLTYEDMGTMANLAFSSLRDIRFDNAVIGMNGPLTGELVTNVRFDGIGQGETAQRNLLTKQIARLPIRLMINIRAPFYRLISDTRSLYDPSAVRDPRDLAPTGEEGDRMRERIESELLRQLRERQSRAAPAAAGEPDQPPAPPPDRPDDEPDIQPLESEAVP